MILPTNDPENPILQVKIGKKFRAKAIYYGKDNIYDLTILSFRENFVKGDAALVGSEENALLNTDISLAGNWIALTI